jgi:Beta-1,3-glucanase
MYLGCEHSDMIFARAAMAVLFFFVVLLMPGCGSGSSDFVSTPGGGGGAIVPQSVEENFHTLTTAVVESDLTTLPRGVRARQVNEVLKGDKGGTATISGDLNVGVDSANPVTSNLDVNLDNYTFYDGHGLDGGTVTLQTVLWGTEEYANGTMLLQAQDVVFTGIGSGTHSFTIHANVVNSKIVRTELTLNGAQQELGFVVNLVNRSTSPPGEVFITIIGKNDAKTAWYYLHDPDAKEMTEFDDAPGTFLTKDTNGAFIGGEKYSLTLSDIPQIGPQTWRLIVPRKNVISGRIFFSFGRKLQGVGINAPYYNSDGVPITTGATATGTLTAGNAEVALSGVDATQTLAVNEPVSYQFNGTTVKAKITQVKTASLIEIAPAPGPTVTTTTELTFTPDPQAITDAKLSLSGPSPTGPPDYLTTFELMELSATTDTTQAQPWYTLFANTTAIDFFSIGLGLTVDFSGHPAEAGQSFVAPSEKTVGFGDSAADILAGISRRDAVIDRFNNTGSPTPATPTEFQAFVTASPAPVPQTGVDPHMTIGKPVDRSLNVIRVLGPPPLIALQPTGDMSKYLDPAFASEWSPFCSAAASLMIQFPISDPAFTFEGNPPVSPTTLNLKCTQAAGANTGLNEAYELPQPTTRIIWECDDTDNPGPEPDNYTNLGTDAHKRLGSIICAAFARGVFPNVADWSDSAKFYTRSDLKYNFFAKVMHDFALDKVVYGFAYDDVYGQDSTLAGPIGLTTDGKVPPSDFGNVVDVTLTIPAFTAPPPPALPGVPLAVEVVQTCGATDVNLAGCVIHFSNATEDINATLDANGQATVKGLSSNVTYTAWVAPGGPNASSWYFSYAAQGKYDGTTAGNWSSSHGTDIAGVVRLQIGRLQPGVGSCLNPQPAAPQGANPPLPTTGSGQANWGNLAP